MKHFTIAFIFTIIFPFSKSLAQDRYQFDHLTIENGLSQSTVGCILKDKTGFMWFGTNDGLNKYNGYEFEIYRFDPYDSTTISDNKIYALFEDSDSVLWIGTRHGLNRYNREKNQFKRFYRVQNGNKTGLSGNFIRSIHEDKEGNIWVGTMDAGLNKYVKSENKFYTYRTPGNEVNISSIICDQDGNIWVGTEKDGVYKLNTAAETFQYFAFDQNNKHTSESAFGKNLYIDNENTLWVGTEGNGLYRFDEKQQSFTRFCQSCSQHAISNNIVKSIVDDNKGNLWIATDGGGLNIFNKKTGNIDVYHYDINNTQSISNDAVYSIYRDNEGIFWIGTFAGGINIVNPNKKQFYHYTQEGWNPNSLSHKAVLSFCEDSKGNIWVGTDGGGLNLFDKNNNRFIHYKHDPNDPTSISSNVVTCIFEDSRDNLWIGTYAGGLNLLDRETGTFTCYKNDPSENKSLINNNVWELLEDKEGNLWIGTLGGLDKFNYKDETFRHYLIEKDKTYSNRIISLHEDSEGRLWLGGNQLGLLNKETGKISIYPYKNEHYQTSTTYDVRCIHEDKSHRLWIATEGAGLNLFDPENGTFTPYTTKDGLSNNSVHQILEDGNGNLWLSTNKGITEFNPETYEVRIYDDNDGLQSNQFSYMAALKSSDGEFYFGGLNGFNVFHPDCIKDNPHVPPVVFTDFIHYNSLQKEKNGTILQKDINYTESIDLPFKSVFTLQFAALNYTSTEKNKYRYQLEGFSNEWIDAGNQRTATYTNLDPGMYTFKVQGSNNDSKWNKEGAQLVINILPPWWKTKVAYAVYIVCIILIFYSFRTYIINRQKLKNRLVIKDLEKKKMEEVNQMKLRFFTNVSHEFRTPLSLILGPLENVLERNNLEGNLKRQLMFMKNNAERLLRLINQLMDFRKIETGNMKLRASKDNIITFTKDIKNAFNAFAKKHNIKYEFLYPKEEINMYFDHDKMDKIIYNLLSNAFKFTPDHGKISILMDLAHENGSEKKGDYLEIVVQDSGIGISADRLPKVFDRFYQIGNSDKLKKSIEREGTGIGLSLTKELIELHNGTIEVQSTEGVGTKFVIRLPIDASYLTPEQIVHERETEHYNHNQLYKYLSADNEPEQQQGTGYANTEGLEKHAHVILIVEDNHEVREFLKVSLEPEYEIKEAGDGISGLELAKQQVPDLIINDIMMPGMDGVQLTKSLKSDSVTSHIPVILLTAKDTFEFKIKGLEIGADDYICKPFNMLLLRTRIKNLIESRTMLRDKFRKDILLEPKEVTVTSSDEKFLTKAMEIVENHISDPDFNVMAFVKEMGMSRSVLYRKLEAITGQSVNEFIRTIRLKRAAQLLSLNEFTISEITYEVGFNDPQYFSKCFSKQFHLTPSAYAAEKKKKKVISR